MRKLVQLYEKNIKQHRQYYTPNEAKRQAIPNFKRTERVLAHQSEYTFSLNDFLLACLQDHIPFTHKRSCNVTGVLNRNFRRPQQVKDRRLFSPATSSRYYNLGQGFW